MAHHLVLGAGPIGRAVTEQLVQHHHTVTVVTRSGTAVDGAESIALAGDDPQLCELAQGAASLVVATNPPYHRWESQWPPVLDNVIAAAERSGAAVVLIGNLYGYPPGVVMTAAQPLAPTTRKGTVRTHLWQTLLAAHQAGRVRATEIRASDYYGPQSLATQAAHAGARLVEPVLARRTAWVAGEPDAPHSWAAVADIAATAVAAATSDRAWGRPWVVPTDAPASLQQLADAIASAGGVQPARLRRIPTAVVKIGGLLLPMLAEMQEIMYQHEAAFVSDGSDTTAMLGVAATPMEQVIAATVASARPQVRTSVGA